VEDFRIGYVADNTTPGFERFAGRVAIPNLCAAGHVVGIKFREIPPADSGKKYDAPAGQQNRLFNLRALNTPSDYIALTEGEIDAISLVQLGVPAVAVPGAQAWNKARHWRLFEGYRRIVLFRDNDDAGSELVKKVLESDLPVLVVNPPHGVKDANEALVAGFGDELVNLVKGAIK
jgi:DNA primase